MRTTFPAHLILIDLLTLVIFTDFNFIVTWYLIT
jgi:hypothetical protein